MITTRRVEKEALLMWRNKPVNEQNMSSLVKEDIFCNFEPFVQLTILKKNIDLEQYRKKYTEKTKKKWETATINDIYRANLVW